MTIHYDQPMSEYLSHPGIGSSHLKQMLFSPRDYLMYKVRNRKDTPQTILGEATHCILTEFNDFENRFAIQPEDWGPKNSGEGHKRWKEFKLEHAGKKVLGWENKQFLDDLMLARSEHKGLCHIFDTVGGSAEVSAYTDLIDGIQLKARTDWLGNDGILWDIKTSSKGMSGYEIYRTIKDMGYHFQAAHHMGVIGDFVDIKGYGWIFVDTDSNSVNIITRMISDNLRAQGERDVEEALALLTQCIKMDEWPRRWDDEILTIMDYARGSF